jgi:hypothetical protein
VATPAIFQLEPCDAASATVLQQDWDVLPVAARHGYTDFALPLLARLAAHPAPRRPGRPRGLILAPTRELAAQIEASIAPLAAAVSLRTLTVFGGIGPGRQVAGLRTGVDVVIACPGRLADHVASGHASLDAVEITVVDEADHMADVGFLPAVRRLLDQTRGRGSGCSSRRPSTPPSTFWSGATSPTGSPTASTPRRRRWPCHTICYTSATVTGLPYWSTWPPLRAAHWYSPAPSGGPRR